MDDTRRKWKYVKWLIIDEISMISYEQLRQINSRIQQIKENETNFGGLNVILMGDLLQLKPVNGHWIYEQPDQFSHETNLWKLFGMIQLEQNQRQIGDKRYGELCSRIRVGTQTAADIDLLISRLYDKLTNKDEFKDSLLIAARKTDVASYNAKMLKKLKNSTKAYKIDAIDIYADGPNCNKLAPKQILYSNEEKCGGMPHTMEIAIGARIMLRRNIDTARGLVNGSIGTITGIEWSLLSRDQLEPGNLPDSILVKFDDDEIAKNFTDKLGDSIRIKPHSVTFEGKKGTHITRRMLPIILSWAITIHKTQGLTLTKAIVCLEGCFGYNMEYVALSRIKTLAGLALMNIDIARFSRNNFTCPGSLLELGIKIT